MNSKLFFLLSALLLVTAEAYHSKFHLLPYSPMRQKSLLSLILEAMDGAAFCMIQIPYSRKFLHGAKFHSFRGYIYCCENKNYEIFNH